MANRDGRDALRGAEEETFDLITRILTSEERAKFLGPPLERAAAKGNRGLALELVGAGADIGKALLEAVGGGHEDIASDLLKSGASITAKDADDRTPLHLAARGGMSEIVELLTVKGADKDAMDNNQRTPLYLAVCWGQMAAVLALLVAGADVSLRCCSSLKEMAVHAAARMGRVEVLRALIEHGADAEAADSPAECTPLIVAAIENQFEVINVLADAGANIEARCKFGYTALLLAANWGSLDSVLALLKHGADVNAQDSFQRTPLHGAVESAGKPASAEVVNCLLRSGADETIVNDAGETALDTLGTDNEFDEDDTDEEYVECMRVRVCVRELLVNALVDKAWRRRGYLVLCDAHPDRTQLVQESGSTRASVASRTRSRTMLERAEAGVCTATAEARTADERTRGNCLGLMAMVLGLPERGIFRMIVAYL